MALDAAKVCYAGFISIIGCNVRCRLRRIAEQALDVSAAASPQHALPCLALQGKLPAQADG